MVTRMVSRAIYKQKAFDYQDCKGKYCGIALKAQYKEQDDDGVQS